MPNDYDLYQHFRINKLTKVKYLHKNDDVLIVRCIIVKRPYSKVKHIKTNDLISINSSLLL